MADGSGVSAPRRKRFGDLFCGAGGLSTGAMRAMREMGIEVQLIGVNHWPIAIDTNRRNHPDHAARIHCSDLESTKPLDKVPEGSLDLLMAAPSCVFHSRARGGKPVHDQQRMDPWHVVRWCTELRVRRILVENVPEFLDWGPCDLRTGRPIKSRKGEYFRAWVAALEAIGFRVKWSILCAADYGDPTTRRRFFLIGCSDRKPLRFPVPSHAPVASTDLAGTRERWRGATQIIDWSRKGSSIFTRKKALAPNTLRRIRAGALRYGWPAPYVAALDALLAGQEPILDVHTDAAAPLLVHLRGTHDHAIAKGARSAEEPLPTLTAGGRHVGLVMATGSGGVAQDIGAPVPTLTTTASPHFVTPLLMGTSGYAAAKPVDVPAPTITTGGGGSEHRQGNARPQLIEPLVVPLSNSSSAGVPRGAGDPLRTITTARGGDMALAQPLVAPYYGGGSGLTAASVQEPVPAVTTKARFGLAEPVLMKARHGDSDGRNPASRLVDLDSPVPALTGSNELGMASAIVMRGNVGTGRTRDMRAATEPVATSTASVSLAVAAPFVLPLTHQGDTRTHAIDGPLPTITGANRGELGMAAAFLVPNFGEDGHQAPRTHSLADPLPTVTATGHIQLAEPVATGVRIDIHYRMLHWRELAAATSFDDEGEVYDFAGTGTEITKQIGNAVPCRMGKALVRALMEDA